jgi:hypothetical protein
MATKAEQFEIEQRLARRAAKTATAEGRRPGGAVPPTEPRVAHNQSARAAKGSAYELEPSPGARPSRKSTRRSPGHLKTDSALRLRTMDRNAAPSSRSR